MADFLNDLMRSSEFLKQNLQGLQAQRSISRANEIVEQIKTSEGDEQAKRSQLQQLSQALVMDLARFGTPADTVQAVSQAISPNRFFQTPEQVAINPDYASPAQQKAAQTMIKSEQDFKMALADQKGSEIREARQQRMESHVNDKLLKAGEQFTTIAKKNLEALDSSTTLIDMIDAGGDVTDAAISGLAARASGEVGALTEADKAPFGGSRAMLSRLRRYASIAATGNLPEADRAELRKLALSFQNAAKRNLQKKASLKAQQTAKVLGLDPNEVMEKILPTNALFDGQLMSGQVTPDQGQTTSSQGQGQPQVPAIRGLYIGK